MPNPLIHRVISLLGYSRNIGKLTHEQKKRDNSQDIRSRVDKGSKCKLTKCGVKSGNHGDAEKTRNTHGNADRHPQNHHGKKENYRQYANLNIAHLLYLVFHAIFRGQEKNAV